MRESTVRLSGHFAVSSEPMDLQFPPRLPRPEGCVVSFLLPWDEAEEIRECWERRELHRLTVQLTGGKSFVGIVWSLSEFPMLNAGKPDLQQSVEVFVEPQRETT